MSEEQEQVSGGTRERVWVEKVDKTTDPPTVVERLFVENGVVVEHEVLPRPQEEETHGE